MPAAGESPLPDVRPERLSPEAVETTEIEAAFDSSDPLVRRRACTVCTGLVTREVESVRPLIPDVGSLLRDDSTAVVQSSLTTLRSVASTDPTMLEACLGDLVTHVETDLAGIRLDGARCLAALTAERPRACVPHVPALVRSIREDGRLEDVETYAEVVADPTTRQTIREHHLREQRDVDAARELLAHVVAACAQAAPAELHDDTASFKALLSDEDPIVVRAGLSALASVAQDDPDAIAVDETLVDCLGHEARRVRAQAIEMLGFLGADSVVPTLRRMGEDDPDEDVSALAAATAEFLEP